MLDFISSENGPLGKVIHYGWRREYQSRGLQHFHIILWIKGAPILGKSRAEDVATFINRYITCNLPDRKNFPTIFKRVSQYQMHNHNSYCMRTKKINNNKIVKVCRFSFPRPICKNLVLRSAAESILGRRRLSKVRLYNLPRTASEQNINDYNAGIMLAWCGNMDIQFIGEKSAALTAYITKYQTKGEKSLAGDDFHDFVANQSLSSRLWNFALRSLSNRECGAFEAADTLLQIPLFGTDPDTTIKWLDVKLSRSRKLKDKDTLLALDENDRNIFCPNWIDTHYPQRPSGLESLNLFDFSRWFDIVTTEPKFKNIIFYKYGNTYLRKRKVPHLINHYNYNIRQQPENYFYTLLLLFKSWRDCNKTYV